MAECIHGFDDGLCAICSPPPPRAGAGERSASTGSRTPRTARPSTSRASTARVTTPPPSIVDQRVYHVTHVSNLAGILATGAIIAGADATPTLDLSSSLTRELRATATVSGGDVKHGTVSDFVPFQLVPDSEPWRQVRSGAREPRWSPAARAAATTDFVFLVSSIGVLTADDREVVLADGDAAATFTRFASGDALRSAFGRLRGTDALAEAELLVRPSVDFDAITLVGVANDPVRDRVREILAAAARSTKVAVYPPWFA